MTKLSQPTTETLAPKHPSLLPIYPADIVKITSVASTYQVVKGSVSGIKQIGFKSWF